MGFSEDLIQGREGERVVREYLRNTNPEAKVLDVFPELVGETCIRTAQQKYGDIQITQKGQTEYVEVKTDKSAQKYGNLFLETLSDDGSRTGKETVGWFHNPEACYDWFVFNCIGRTSIVVRRDELKEWADKADLKLKPMTYNQQQYNRSWGLIAPIKRVLAEVPSAKEIQL